MTANVTTQIDRDEVLKATAENLTLSVYLDGSAATLSSCSYVIYDSGVTEKASGSITPSGDDSNELVAQVLSTYFTEVEENCRVKWTFTTNSEQFIFHNLFDVVANKIVNPIITADLSKRYPNLTDDLWSSQTNFDTQIQDAFVQVKQDIKNRGRRPSLIVDSSQINQLIIHKAFEIIFGAFSRAYEDFWWQLSLKHGKIYRNMFASTQFKYDSAGDDSVVDMNFSLGSRRLKR